MMYRTFERRRLFLRRFTTYSDAATVALRTHAGTVVLGDDGDYWVTTMAEAAFLTRLGYSLA